MKKITNYNLRVMCYNHHIITSPNHLICFFCFLFSVFCFFPSALNAQTKADTIHITHYDINLEIRDFTNQQINGYTEVEIEAKIAPLSKIYLHFLALTVDSVVSENKKIGFSHQGAQLEIELPFSTIEQKQSFRVYYHGKPDKEQWGGFFFDGSVAYNIGVAFGKYPHSFGRVWFPCIDEFTDKSTYTFNITTDADKKAICGGMLVDSVPVGDGIRWTWEMKDKIPTYLASVAVDEYQAFKDTILSVNEKILPIEIYANSATIGKVPGSFVNLKTFIRTYEKRWGPCLWQRVGYVGVPFKDGAMEHATNIALPQSYINGNTNNQITIAHELAHFWFGNLITCATSQNMWINEGFATFGEYLSYEALDPTLQKYNTEIKKLHFDVLKNDGGLYALDNVPTNATYSFTSYKKGGLVVHTLRNYMGDELHFNSIKQFLDENKYGNIDSKEFFEKLSQISKMDLNDFYLGWVHQKGFLNFNIDSIKLKIGSNNVYQVAFKQKLYQAEYFANSNKVDVEFVSASGEKKLVEKMQFSDVHEIVEIELPFEPVFWAIDPDEKMGSACFAHTQTITKTGTTSFSNTNFSINVSEIEGEAIIRVEHNPVAPTPAKSIPPNIFRVSEKHYWRIGFLQSSAMQAAYIFTYNTNTYDADLLQGYSQNDLLLLYRKDASHDWQIIPATIKTGTLTVDHLLPGEYTFGVGEEASVNEWENKIEVYPNPTTGELKITNYKLRITNVEVFDVFGKKREGIKARKHEGEIDVNISHLPVGSYFVQIQTDKGTITRKIIKN